MNAMTRERASHYAFYSASAILFAATTIATITWCASMSAMGEMHMPGGWTMSMAWMRMPGQTWSGAAASFIGMWIVMMIAMMLPSLVPMLSRFRDAVTETSQIDRLTALVGLGYFFVWSAFGLIAFIVGAALAAVAMEQPPLARSVPMTTGVIIVLAGAFQFTTWKAQYLACCREQPARNLTIAADPATALRLGVKLGLHCLYSCAGLTTILLIAGVMDLRVMTVVTAGITAERLAPHGEYVARVIGAMAIGTGLFVIVMA